MILLTSFYSDAHPHRRGEFLECIRRNCSNQFIDEVHVFIEDSSDPGKVSAMLAFPSKVQLIAAGRRLTFRELFGYANQNFACRDVIIANGDIFFDQSLKRLRGYDLLGKLLCLSRWDVNFDGTAQLFDQPWSQDAWIFRAPLRDFFSDFPLGIPTCDSRLVWEADKVGLVLSNPSRSIRANHLHLSNVRRYGGSNRVPGPVASVPLCFLGSPWLWYLACGGGDAECARLAAEALADHPRASSLLVTGSATSTGGLSIEESYSAVTVIKVPHPLFCDGGVARSEAISIAAPDGTLCFIDDFVLPAEGFSDFVLTHIDEKKFFVPCENGGAPGTLLVCSKSAFNLVGGFDRSFHGWGEELADLQDALRRYGFTAQTIPETFLSHVEGHGAKQLGDGHHRGRNVLHRIHAAYRRAKSAILSEIGEATMNAEVLIEIYCAISRHKLRQATDCPDTPLAEIAFCESMGYSVNRLEPGQSSHNNDWRPFRSIPAALLGLPYTQVVANSVSTIKIEFLEKGKLYALVGTDWEGHGPASAWLARTGCRTALTPLETERGTTFEVWSLIGDAGDVIVLPTQVMLVAAALIQREAPRERDQSSSSFLPEHR